MNVTRQDLLNWRFDVETARAKIEQAIAEFQRAELPHRTDQLERVHDILGGLSVALTDALMDADEPVDGVDTVVPMPPKRRYEVTARIESVTRGQPSEATPDDVEWWC